jgi:hypothetical protein
MSRIAAPSTADTSESQGFAPRALPLPNRQLTELAEEAARRAAPLVSPGRLPLLGITASLDGRLRLSWWNPRFERVAEIVAGTDSFSPAATTEGAVQRAGLALIAHLSGRWPPQAVPRALGVVTDGTGLAFSPQHPSPLAPGWLLRHGMAGAHALAILPFASEAPLLALREASARVH